MIRSSACPLRRTDPLPASTGQHGERRSYTTPWDTISPRGLRLHDFQRAVWSLLPLDFDPDNREMLLDCCPVCRFRLGWNRTHGVAFCDQCPSATTDLRDYDCPRIDVFDEEALIHVTNFINPNIGVIDVKRGTHPDLVDHTRSDLFHFAVRLAHHCQTMSGEQRDMRASSRYLEAAGRALLNWPDAFSCLATEQSRLSGSSKEVLFRRIMNDPTVAPTIRTHVRRLREIALRKQAIHGYRGHPNPSSNAAVNRSETGPRSMRPRLLDNQQKSIQHLGIRTDHQTTVNVLRDVSAVRAISNYLGLPVPDLIDVYWAGLLPELEEHLVPLGFAPRRSGDGGLLSELTTISPCRRIGYLFNLASCRFALDSELSSSWSAVLRGLIGNILEVQTFPRTRRGVLCDLFPRNFDQLKSLLKSEQSTDRSHDIELTHREVAMITGRARAEGPVAAMSAFFEGPPTVRKFVEVRKKWALSSELLTLAHISGRHTGDFHRSLSRSAVANIRLGGERFWCRTEALHFLARMEEAQPLPVGLISDSSQEALPDTRFIARYRR
jgi:hypothetical protein